VAKPLKYEEVYLRAYDSISNARASIGRYLDFYNGRRWQRLDLLTHARSDVVKYSDAALEQRATV
jgi:hypothetical protein